MSAKKNVYNKRFVPQKNDLYPEKYILTTKILFLPPTNIVFKWQKNYLDFWDNVLLPFFWVAILPILTVAW